MFEAKGLITPVLTALDENEKFNPTAYKDFINMLIEAGVHGIFPLGTNGEFYAFNNEEKYEIIKKESDWNKYYSSNKTIKEKMKSGELDIESREIIKVCFTEKQMTYFETQALFCYGVLEYPEQYYNDNILGKFYKKDLSNEEFDN